MHLTPLTWTIPRMRLPVSRNVKRYIFGNGKEDDYFKAHDIFFRFLNNYFNFIYIFFIFLNKKTYDCNLTTGHIP